MKNKILTTLIFIFSLQFLIAQERYEINGKTYELKTEASGSIDLLWNIIDGQYRYFIRKDNIITELVNTRDSNRKYQKEYKDVLKSLTSDRNLDVKRVNLTLPSLRRFIDNYNTAADSNYTSSFTAAKVKARLLLFGGITNNIFVDNPNNSIAPLFGAAIEFIEETNLPRHALFFSARHALEQDDFEFSETQLAIGYRFRFINKANINIYTSVKLATFSFLQTPIVLANNSTTINNSTNFDAPITFGLGADIKITPKLYITLAYNEIVALFQGNSDNFPIDFATGIKFVL